MVLAEVTGFLSSVKAAKDIIKGISSLSTNVAVKEKASELLETIISLQDYVLKMQSEYSSLLESKNDLEKKLMNFESWEKTKSQYRLKEVGPDIFVYSYQKMDDSKKPKHWLCTSCFKDNKKSIIQLKVNRGFEKIFICPECNLEIRIPTRNKKKWPSRSIDV